MEEALALKANFTPRDSIVTGVIGRIGYYSELHIYDRFGLVDRRVAMQPRQLLRSPGHDKKAPLSLFFENEPALVHNSRSRSTIVLYSRIRGSP